MTIEKQAYSSSSADFIDLIQSQLPLRKPQRTRPSEIIIAYDLNNLDFNAFKSHVHSQFRHFTLPFYNLLTQINLFTEEECAHVDFLISELPNQKKALSYLCAAVAQKIQPVVADYAQNQMSHEDLNERQAFRSFVLKLNSRLKKIRPDVIPDGSNELERANNGFTKTLTFGIKNIAHFSLSLFFTIPSVFERQQGRMPTSDEYELIADSSLSFIHQLARGEDLIFNVIVDTLRRPHVISKNEKMDWLDQINIMGAHYPLHADDFTLHQNNLQLTKSCIDDLQVIIFEHFKQGYFDLNNYKLGCPAFHLFEPIFKISKSLARHTIFNKPEFIANLPPHA